MTSWLSGAAPAPKILVLPPGAVDLGEADAAIELWEHYSHKRLDDTQRLVVQVMMAQGADGCWAAKTTGREMPRQNGKGDEIEVVELWGLVTRSEAILHTVHDAVMLATQAQQRMLGVLEGHADLRRKIKRVWRGTGQQMIEMRNGGVVWYRTRTGGGGRGVDDIDRLVVDEAQHATEEQVSATSPTLLANPNPQLNAMGTAGLRGASGWWWGVRKRALSEDPGAFGYVGHTAETVRLVDGLVVQEPVDSSDRSVWAACNPALAANRGGGMAFLEEQYRRLPATYQREHLGVWDPPDDEAGGSWLLFDRQMWEDGKVPAGEFEGPFTYAVEVTPDRDRYSVSAAGLHGDRIGVEVLASGSYDEDKVLARLVKIAPQAKGVVIDSRGPAGTLVRPLKDLHGVEVLEVNVTDYARACQSFYDGHKADLAHSDQDPELDAAVAAAVKRSHPSGWLFDRSGQDVTPLASAALARWGHLEIPDAEPEPDFFTVSLRGAT